jgi:hypothetical protein
MEVALLGLLITFGTDTIPSFDISHYSFVNALVARFCFLRYAPCLCPMPIPRNPHRATRTAHRVQSPFISRSMSVTAACIPVRTARDMML